VWLVAGLLLAAGGGDAAFAQEAPKHDPRYEVRLIDRSVIPDPKIEKFLARERYGVLQFYDTPTEAQHRALAALGVLLADIIPNFAYTASVPRSVKQIDLRRLNARAYFPLERNDKLDPGLARGEIPPWALGDDGRAGLVVSVFPGLRAGEAEAALRKVGATVLMSSALLERLTVQVAPADVGHIADLAFVRFVQPVPPPPAPGNDGARAVIGTSAIQPPPWGTDSFADGLTGTGVNLGIWDLGPDINHPDLSAPRVTVVEHAPACFVGFDHPTWVAGTMAGDGASSSLFANGGTPFQWAGMAPEATVFEWSTVGGTNCWEDASFEMVTAVAQQGIVLANNSWYDQVRFPFPGCALFGDYAYAIPYDQVVRTTNLGLVFIAGNERGGFSANTCGLSSGYGTVLPPGTAKNVITVGAIDKTSTMSSFGGWGPTSDGRLKPDVMAVGVNVKTTVPNNAYDFKSGTSFAAPGVTGTAALLVERYRQLNSGQNPKPALTKAILLNTADDLAPAGPDFQSGYGRVNAPAADRTLKDHRYLLDSVADSGTKSFTLNVGPPPLTSSCTLKVMLAYTDWEGVSWITQQNLVNDLDLTLVDPSGNTHYPLTLDPSNPSAAAVAGPNHRDNVEQVVVNNAAPGPWTVVVSGLSAPAPPGVQEFAITWACFCVTPPADMVAWWPLDEGAGATSFQDLIGGNNATPFASPVGGAQAPQPVSGTVNGAIHFPKFGNGLSGARVSPQGALATVGSADFTIDAWVKFQSAPADRPHYIVNKFDSTTSTGYALYVISPGFAGNERLEFVWGDGSSISRSETICCLTPGQWHHVAVTFARILGGIDIHHYVDGVQRGQEPRPNYFVGSLVNFLVLEIGWQPSTLDEPITIDELEIFNVALPQSDIQRIYNAGPAGKCK
jgi:hypothetical protein